MTYFLFLSTAILFKLESWPHALSEIRGASAGARASPVRGQQALDPEQRKRERKSKQQDLAERKGKKWQKDDEGQKMGSGLVCGQRKLESW